MVTLDIPMFSGEVDTDALVDLFRSGEKESHTVVVAGPNPVTLANHAKFELTLYGQPIGLTAYFGDADCALYTRRECTIHTSIPTHGLCDMLGDRVGKMTKVSVDGEFSIPHGHIVLPNALGRGFFVDFDRREGEIVREIRCDDSFANLLKNNLDVFETIAEEQGDPDRDFNDTAVRAFYYGGEGVSEPQFAAHLIRLPDGDFKVYNVEPHIDFRHLLMVIVEANWRFCSKRDADANMKASYFPQ